MRTISPGNLKIRKLLGKQQGKHTEYRLMKYVLQKDCQDGMLLHNVITGQLLQLDIKEKDLFAELVVCSNREEPSLYIEWPLSCPDSKKMLFQALIEDFFFVSLDFNEKETAQKLRMLMKRLFPSNGFNHYLILPTTGCNARCAYCFERGLRHMNMDEPTADLVVDFISSHKSSQVVELHWFGGEPLLGQQRIDQICEGLTKKNVGFKSIMTSNGYLFTQNLVSHAVANWHLVSIQITLDGPEEIYNKVKSYVKVDGSPFQRVIQNICYLLEEGIHVSIRLNLDEGNAEDLQKLISDLKYTFGQSENLNVYVAKVMDEVCNALPARTVKDDDKLNAQFVSLNNSLERMGLNRRSGKLLSLKVNSCMADSDETVVILPDGKLEKCETIREGDSFGNLMNQEINRAAKDIFKETFEYDYCGACPLYPACILLKACPTKQKEQREICRKSIEFYCDELEYCYRNNKKSTYET